MSPACRSPGLLSPLPTATFCSWHPVIAMAGRGPVRGPSHPCKRCNRGHQWRDSVVSVPVSAPGAPGRTSHIPSPATEGPNVTADPRTANVWMLGGGIASMATAAFLIRDAGVPGENIHILETLDVPGGSLDGAASPVQPGYVTLGRRMLEEEAYRCLWNLLESVPRPRRPRQVRAARHRRLQLLGHDARSRAAHQFRPRDPRRGGVRVQHQRPDGADRAARAVRARARRPPDR